MKTREKYVSNLSEGDVITESFIIESKNLATARNGKPYINLTLRDKTGTINAKIWDDADIIFSQIGSSQFAEVSGLIESYQGKLQLKVTSIRSIKSEKVNMNDFVATTTKDIEKTFKELCDICSTVKDKNLSGLLSIFLSDEELPTWLLFFSLFVWLQRWRHVHYQWLLTTNRFAFPEQIVLLPKRK